MKIIVDNEKCPKNHHCPAIKVCPVGAISQRDENTLPEIDYSKCILCKKCVTFCPKGALQVRE